MASGQVIGKFFPASAESYSALFDMTPNARPVLVFDGAADQEAIFTDVLSSYAGGGVTVDTWWFLSSAVAGSFRVQAAFERLEAALDAHIDSFAAFKSAGGAAPASARRPVLVTLTFAHGAEMDGLLDGELYRFKIRRDADGTSGVDDIATGAELLSIAIRET